MEYFNFSGASDDQGVPPLDLDELSSLYPEYGQDEANECFDSLFFDKSHMLPVDPAPTVQPGPIMLKLINNIEIEAIPQLDDPDVSYPMFRAKNPCDLCARMGLDCYLASRGTMITGCTCCISLYKDCSFTHPKIPRGFVSNFKAIGEDKAETIFGREHQRSLKSFEEGRPRKTGARFPRDAVKILKQWLSEHSDHPYPNEREKDELKQLTGLKRSQISNWLANARRRGKVRPAEGSEPSSPLMGAIDIPGSGNTLSELNPLDRWKASPPENEPASMTAIARAVTATPMPSNRSLSRQNSLQNSRASSRQNSSSESTNISMLREPSVSSFETRESSTNSDLTFASSRSNQSKRSFSSGERRRRRRAPMTQRAAAQATKTRSARIFQCTFCTDTFPAKYDWQRHEKSLHLALERWTCCPGGGTYTIPSTGLAHCVFCSGLNPSAEHLESDHNYLVCQEQTVQERTFYRKDHLRQHLKLRHSAKFEKHMESWKTTTNEIKSCCGFCPSKFTTWSQRADHLAAHFRNGADMSTWTGGWGFEPSIERCVENAIPPYLIGHERQTMEPYVARMTKRGSLANTPMGNVRGRNRSTPGSSGSGSGVTYGTSAPTNTAATPRSGSMQPASGNVTDSDAFEEPDQLTRDSNCWGRLEQELAKYVTQFRLQNQLPTDKDLQSQARMIIYEDDDPWNYTCADNQTWLDTFKWQHGIGGVTDVMQQAGLGDVVDQEGNLANTSLVAGGAGGGLMGYGRDGDRLLDQVEVMAPYVIKGGNKATGGSQAGGNEARIAKGPARRHNGGRRTHKAVRTERAAKSSRGGSSVSSMSSRDSMDMPLGYGSVPNGMSNEMDLDFEGVDFQNLNLDLGMTGDGLGNDGMMGDLGPATSLSAGYAPINTLQQQQSNNDDFFGGQGFEMHADNKMPTNNQAMDFNFNMAHLLQSTQSPQTLNMNFNPQQIPNNLSNHNLASLDDAADDDDFGAPLQRSDTCISHGKDHSAGRCRVPTTSNEQQRSSSMSSAHDSKRNGTTVDDFYGRPGAVNVSPGRQWSVPVAVPQGQVHPPDGKCCASSVPDLSFMSVEEVRALEGWTGNLGGE
jgi:hypothetical protein